MPELLADFDAENPLLCAAMHPKVAAITLKTGLLLNPTLLQLAQLPMLGDPAALEQRLQAPMRAGFSGRCGEYTQFSYTTKPISAFASCGPKVIPRSVRVSGADIVIAAIRLSDLIDSHLPVIFSDWVPTRTDAVLSVRPALDQLPWKSLRTGRFDGKNFGYNAEALVHGVVPITLLSWAVSSIAARDRLISWGDHAVRPPLEIAVRPNWFFS